VSRPRNIQKLITEWVCQTHTQHAREYARGYDARYAHDDLDRERARAEATAASALAKQFIAADCNAPTPA
jgi:hypothetical protein